MKWQQLLILLTMAFWGCGVEQNQPDGVTKIEGPVLANSELEGVAFTGISVDQSFQAGRFYFYDFSAGTVYELSDAESGDPWLMWDGAKVLLFNRQLGRQDVRAFSPVTDSLEASLTDPVSTASLAAGDPWAGVRVSSGELVLATPQAGGLAVFDESTGIVTHTLDLNLAVNSLQAGALVSQGTKVFAAHRGINANNVVTGEAQLFNFSIASGAILATDSNPTTAEIDGYALPMSSPTAFVNQGQTPLLVGLCSEDWQNCEANAATFSPTATSLSTQTGAVPNLMYWNQIVDGPNANSVYAHVLDPSDNLYKVVEWNTATGETSTVHIFSSERLFGISYDSGSRTLFVGEVSNLMGELILYRDNAEIGRIELPTVPYQFAAVP